MMTRDIKEVVLAINEPLPYPRPCACGRPDHVHAQSCLHLTREFRFRRYCSVTDTVVGFNAKQKP